MTSIEKYLKLQSHIKHNYNPPPTLGDDIGCYSLDELIRMWGHDDVATRLLKERSIYVHIPFCAKRRCSFCMYNSSINFSDSELNVYLRYIEKEWMKFKNLFSGEIRNLYIGGGTPSVYSPQELSTLLSYFKGVKFSEDGERTCEMSPSTATIEHLDAVFEAGINRVSFGVQSFDEEILKNVNRVFSTPEEVGQLVAKARKLNAIDVNLDLMFGLPGSNGEDVLRSAIIATKLDAMSISIYTYRKRAGMPDRKEQQEIASQFFYVKNKLEAHGWECVAGDENTEYHLFYSPERSRRTLRYQTTSNGVLNYDLCGLGVFANGFSPSLTYSCDTQLNEIRHQSMDKFRVWKSNIDDQIRLGVINLLYARRGQIDKKYFNKVYGIDFDKYFEGERKDLISLGKAYEDEKIFKVLTSSKHEEAVLRNFFNFDKIVRQKGANEKKR
jgi:coproporphyrinogen III oxidase-like Fe-S oxidoreductase